MKVKEGYVLRFPNDHFCLKKKKKSNLCLFIWYVSTLGISILNYKDFLQECIVLFGIHTSSLLKSTPKYFQIKCRAIVLNT